MTEIRSDIINVTVCVFPSGETLFIATSLGEDYLRKVIKEWKVKNQQHYDDCMSGVVHIIMPKEKYYSITTTNQYKWPE